MKKGLIISAATIFLDQLHKYIMIYVMELPRFMLNNSPIIESGSKNIELTSFFNIVMVWNRGVSFGMFNSGEVAKYQPLLLIALALLIVALLLNWLRKTADNLQIWGIGLIIGGALGNVIDRIMYGAVADFFDFHLGEWHWPAFNIADSCICIGVFILVIESFSAKRSK